MCLQELALRWSIGRAPRRSEQQTLGGFHLAAHFISTAQLDQAKDTAKTLRKVAPASAAAKELSTLATAGLGEKPEVEMRLDASDGNPYSFESFVEVYGPRVRCLSCSESLVLSSCSLGWRYDLACRHVQPIARLLNELLLWVQAEELWAIAELAPPSE